MEEDCDRLFGRGICECAVDVVTPELHAQRANGGVGD